MATDARKQSRIRACTAMAGLWCLAHTFTMTKLNQRISPAFPRSLQLPFACWWSALWHCGGVCRSLYIYLLYRCKMALYRFSVDVGSLYILPLCIDKCGAQIQSASVGPPPAFENMLMRRLPKRLLLGMPSSS